MKNIAEFIVQNLLKSLIFFGALAGFIYILSPFLMAIILGGILALALNGVVGWLRAKGYSLQKSINILVAVLILVFFVPTLVFIIRGSSLVMSAINNPDLMKSVNSMGAEILDWVESYGPTLGLKPVELQTYFHQGLQKLSEGVVGVFGKLVGEVPSLLMFSLIVVISAYLFLNIQDRVLEFFKKYIHLDDIRSVKFLNILQSSSREVLFSNVLTGFVQALIVSLGAWACGYKEVFLIFFICFNASFIPLLGVGPIALVLSLFSFYNSEIASGVVLLVVSGITGVSDNFLRPYVASRLGEVEVPSIIRFLVVIGGVIAFGLPGLFLGPFISSLVFGILPLIFEDYLEQR